MHQYYEAEGIPLEVLQRAINDAWSELAPGSPCPYIAERPAEGLGVIETFWVALVARVVGEFTVRGLDLLWNEVIYPQLEAKFGTSLQRAKRSEGADSQ